MIHVEVNSGIRAIHVYAADHFLKHGQGHAQQRMNVGFDNAVHIAETTSAGNIGSEYRNALFETWRAMVRLTAQAALNEANDGAQKSRRNVRCRGHPAEWRRDQQERLQKSNSEFAPATAPDHG